MTLENSIKKEVYNIIDVFKNEIGMLNKVNKEIYSQFYTPQSIADYMVSLFNEPSKHIIRILDPGCGFGILTGAFLSKLLKNNTKVKKVTVTMYEIDKNVVEIAKYNMDSISQFCMQEGINLVYEIKNENFICAFNSIDELNKIKKYDYVITNPPYKKLSSDSADDVKLKSLGINVPNYYAAFIALAKRMLNNKGELVAITPRSFCNGSYFLDFRKDFISDMVFDKIHLFESRKDVFEEEVLQENIIYHCTKRMRKRNDRVLIKYSNYNVKDEIYTIDITADEVIFPTDENLTIRILKDKEESNITKKIHSLVGNLVDLNIEISTGPVVDFRENKELLHKNYKDGSVPLFYSEHLSIEGIEWPKKNVKKYNYILLDNTNFSKMRQSGIYILVKRMTSKEENRRVIAALCDGNRYDFDYLAFDNKVNYFHYNKLGLPLLIAKGLTIYLNSTIIDMYFRTFSGSTQVNATDLRSLNYPSILQLQELGKRYNEIIGHQNLIDEAIEEVLFSLIK